MGDMIETYKILSRKYDTVAAPSLATSTILKDYKKLVQDNDIA